jgi:fatty acid desaturase
MYGAWLHVTTGLTQHAGLAEDVLDHRLNSRTVYLNPVMRFLYWNMNYHIEHHMFPMVPYHALPQLHEEMKHYCPPPYPSLFAAYREIIPALIRQMREPGWHIPRELPPGAPAFAAVSR